MRQLFLITAAFATFSVCSAAEDEESEYETAMLTYHGEIIEIVKDSKGVTVTRADGTRLWNIGDPDRYQETVDAYTDDDWEEFFGPFDKDDGWDTDGDPALFDGDEPPDTAEILNSDEDKTNDLETGDEMPMPPDPPPGGDGGAVASPTGPDIDYPEGHGEQHPGEAKPKPPSGVIDYPEDHVPLTGNGDAPPTEKPPSGVIDYPEDHDPKVNGDVPATPAPAGDIDYPEEHPKNGGGGGAGGLIDYGKIGGAFGPLSPFGGGNIGGNKGGTPIQIKPHKCKLLDPDCYGGIGGP
ncbi:hypothetical protein ELI25_29505 (plasmid) [Rhizobium ruizarguesonis]|uniref:hypothetical protein n=1 Tax=Rhizobium ruizarguesonis TaxID=2081791 RepID=UPI0010305FF3|nr:hypothetical protein [Rhizobium ruizarguesonis]TAW06608.1 hypothetical protein ELI25_29505 [Rhizobium ruizarguesonis]